jgi:acetyltransferase-like isoleucine patch superfamily enzyme/glycosyltransferase involved in cell wall biosynthesis
MDVMVGLDDDQMNVHALSEVFFDMHAISKPSKPDTLMSTLIVLPQSNLGFLLGLNLALKWELISTELTAMLLSICIPTKNRAAVLQKSLQSIVSQDIFSERDDIEIVVCDNASEDNTAAVTKEFVDYFKGKIRYQRNSLDIEDANFEQALRHGQGEFLKLANDSLNWLPGSLEKMVRLVEMTQPLKPVLFFLNQSRPTEESITSVNDMDSFLLTTSYHITWIGGFGIWKNQLSEMSDFSRHAGLKLAQVDAVLRLMNISKSAYVCNLPMFQILPTGPKGGYNIAEVFGSNYLSILRQFKDQISDSTISILKREVLEKHILPFYCSDTHDFGKVDIEQHLSDFAEEPYYANMLSSAKAQRARDSLKRFQQNAPQIWRQRNSHNQTVIRNLFDLDKVKVGRATYGPLNIQEWGHPDEQLNIGHYVSISEGVTFLLGGNHPYQGITTFPVKVKFLGHEKEAQTKGAINVGDDVWLGHNAMVMSGVTISQGAVVAAGSVVTKNVPPYAIVAGNPARVIKYRFPEATIQALLKINYAEIKPEDLAQIGLNLYETFDTPEFASALDQLIKKSKEEIRK